MIEITDRIAIDPSEIETFCFWPDPGEGTINAVSTAVQVRFDLRHSPSLPSDVRTRAERLAGEWLTEDGVIVITADAGNRTQKQNRDEALAQLIALLKQAARPPASP